MTMLPSVKVGDIYVYQGKRYKSLEAVEAAEANFIAKAERAAGRELSLRELLHGVEHVEDRDRAAQIHDKAFYVKTVTPPQADVHPFDAAQHSLDNRVQTREQLNARMRQAYDARVSGEKFVDPDAARREEAIAHANELLHSVLYSPHVPQSIVEQARQAVVRAQRGDLAEYKTASAELIVRIAQHKTDRVVAADLKRATELSDLPAQFEVEPLADKPSPKPGAPTWQDIMAERDPAERHRMYTAMEAAKSEAPEDATS